MAILTRHDEEKTGLAEEQAGKGVATAAVPQKVTPDHPGSPPDGWVRKRASLPREPWSHVSTQVSRKNTRLDEMAMLLAQYDRAPLRSATSGNKMPLEEV
ncbi:hypothetical protein B0T13DRAFT_514922 [Neurospora crassa]|nr:hypothetical protein B0T13DRAFT_514922 [Neurospora crassa]